MQGLFEQQRSGKLASPTRKAVACSKELGRLGFRCATRGWGQVRGANWLLNAFKRTIKAASPEPAAE